MRYFSPRTLLLLLFALALVFAGCGDDKKELPPPPTGDGTDQVDMMVDVEPDEGDMEGDADMDIADTDMDVTPDPPTVVIQSPEEPTALDSDQILPPSIEFSVICLVERSPGGPEIDTDSITIEATAPDGTVLEGTVLTGENEGEYTADFTLPSEENGAVEISCSASDTGDPVQTSSDEVTQFVDFGPSVTINSPSDGAIITDGIVNVEVEVLASPIDNVDPDSEVDTESISVMVGTTPVSLTFTGNGTYTGTLDLEEESGPRTVEVSAANQRTPDAIARTEVHIITLRPPNAPVVTISSPIAPTTLDSDEILPASQSVSVTCEATQGSMGQPIDPGSVTIELTEPNGNVQNGTVTPGPGADEYSADFTLTSEENGAVSITCNASDTGTPVVSSFDTITQFVDFGPIVTINSPNDGAVITDGLIDVEVQVQRSEIDTVDPGSAVDTNSVSVQVGGTPVSSLIFIGNGTYTGTVDLGTQSGPRFVEASAANQRTPNPVTRTATHTITLTPPPPPVVSITTPDTPANLNSDEILPPNQMVSVVCNAAPAAGGLPLDSGSVTIELTEPNGNVQNGTVTSGPGTNEFSADFTLTSEENGGVSITCSASDTGNTVQTSSDTVNQFIDFGPVVRFIQPADGSVLNGTIDIEVEVLESPVQAGDTAAAVNTNSIAVEDGSANPVMLTGQGNGIYTGTYDLPGMGTQMVSFTLSASNERQPTALQRSTSIQITADADAPSISLVTPVMGDLVGGQQEIRALIQDADGINPSTAEATINGSLTVPLSRVGMTDEWVATLDTSQFPQTVFDLLIVISADDNVGNSASTTALAFELDNTPPIADLDPADIRVQQSGTNTCSPLFDPLGSAPGSEDIIGPQPLFRAMVTDEANDTPTSQAVGMAGGTVQLLVLNDESNPLLVDSTGDGDCDMVNPELNRTASPGAGVSLDALEEILTVVSPAGVPDYTAAMDQSTLWGDYSCVAGTDMNPPPSLCANAPDMNIVFADPDTGDSTIYARSPSMMNCVGNTLGLQSRNITDGWICAALEVTDSLGNTSVSAAIPLCVDLSGGTMSCGGAAPDCTGTYDPMAMTVDASASCSVADSPGNQVYSLP